MNKFTKKELAAETSENFVIRAIIKNREFISSNYDYFTAYSLV